MTEEWQDALQEPSIPWTEAELRPARRCTYAV